MFDRKLGRTMIINLEILIVFFVLIPVLLKLVKLHQVNLFLADFHELLGIIIGIILNFYLVFLSVKFNILCVHFNAFCRNFHQFLLILILNQLHTWLFMHSPVLLNLCIFVVRHHSIIIINNNVIILWFSIKLRGDQYWRILRNFFWAHFFFRLLRWYHFYDYRLFCWSWGKFRIALLLWNLKVLVQRLLFNNFTFRVSIISMLWLLFWNIKVLFWGFCNDIFWLVCHSHLSWCINVTWPWSNGFSVRLSSSKVKSCNIIQFWNLLFFRNSFNTMNSHSSIRRIDPRSNLIIFIKYSLCILHHAPFSINNFNLFLFLLFWWQII